MKTDTLIMNDSVELYYHVDLKIIHHKIKKWLTDEELRSLARNGQKELETRQAEKWLSDDRGNGALSPENEAWVNDVWLPEVIQAGRKFWAIVLPERAVGQMNIKRYAANFAQRGLSDPG